MTNGYLIIINHHGNIMTPRQRQEVQERWDSQSLQTYKIYQDFLQLIIALPADLRDKHRSSINWITDAIERHYEDEIGHAENLLNYSEA